MAAMNIQMLSRGYLTWELTHSPIAVVVVTAAQHASGMEKIEGSQHNHGESTDEGDEVEGGAEILRDQSAGVEIHRHQAPRDGGEAEDDLGDGGFHATPCDVGVELTRQPLPGQGDE